MMKPTREVIADAIKRHHWRSAATMMSGSGIPIPQKLFDHISQDAINRMMECGYPDEEISHERAVWKGGLCPVCGVDYKMIPSDRELEPGEAKRDYVFYSPQCSCMDTIAKLKEREGLFRSMELPKDYWWADLNNWHYELNAENDRAHREVYDYMRASDRPNGIIMHGNPGTGKTRCGAGLLIAAADKGRKAIYISVAGIEKRVLEYQGDYVESVLKYDTIFLDDIDKSNLGNEWVQRIFFQLINSIITEGKEFIMTTNIPTKKEFGNLFIGATADRIVNNYFVKFDGRSYREIKMQYGRDKDEK